MYKKWLGFFFFLSVICITGIFLLTQFQLNQVSSIPIQSWDAVLQFQACPPKSNNPNCPPPSPTNPPPSPPPPTNPPSNSGSSGGNNSASDQPQAGGFNLHGSQTAQAQQLLIDINVTPTFTLPPDVTQFASPTNTISAEVVPTEIEQSESQDYSVNNIFIIVTLIILVVIFFTVVIAARK